MAASTSGGPAPRLATPADADTLSHVAARAFLTDPVHRWMHGNHEADQARRSPRMFAVALRQSIRSGTAYTIDNRSLALWEAPDHRHPGPRELFELAIHGIPAAGPAVPRVLRLMLALDAHRPKAPHWYLFLLATDPAAQGQGLGWRLVTPMLERCDHEGTAAYLESTNPKNVPFYESLGFRVLGSFAPKGGPPLVRMERPPR
jgi:GNAT superfamily N-acetyltransferase